MQETKQECVRITDVLVQKPKTGFHVGWVGKSGSCQFETDFFFSFFSVFSVKFKTFRSTWHVD